MNHDHCADHRRALYAAAGYQAGGDVDHHASVDRSEVLSNILTDGLDSSLGDLVADYLGNNATKKLDRRRRRASNCQEIADAAKAILNLKDKAHELTGKGVASLLPSGTPQFARQTAAQIAKKLPLPWDAKLEAIARGLQAFGIFLCMVQLLPPTACPCLGMIVNEMTNETIKDSVTELISQGRNDLRAGGNVAA